MIRFLGLALLLAGMAGSSFAAVAAAPEIDGTTGAAAIALLFGGILILQSRKRK